MTPDALKALSVEADQVADTLELLGDGADRISGGQHLETSAFAVAARAVRALAAKIDALEA